MEVALVTFVGAGLTSLSAGFGIAVPEGAIASGFELVRYLSKEDNPRTKSLVMQTVGEIWQDWRGSNLPPDIARQHVSALPILMDRHRHPGAMLIGAIGAAAASAKQGGQGNTVHGHRLAAHVVGAAREAGTFTEFGLSEPIAFFFLERLYTRLLAERGYVDALLPILDVYFYKGLWRSRDDEPQGTTSTAPAAAEVEPLPTSDIAPAWADEAVDIVHASEPEAPHIVVSDASASAPIAGVPATAVEPADLAKGATAALSPQALAHCQSLASSLIDMTGGTPTGRQLRLTAAAALHASDLRLADRQLAAAEDAELQAAQTDIDNVRRYLRVAADTRAVRASIEEIRGNWRRAARHYAAATRCLPTSDSDGRGVLLTRQAMALMKQGEVQGDTPALAEAAAAFAEAGNLQKADIASEDWAMGQLTLATLLIVLGEREGRIERFEAAARHARTAAEVWSRTRNMTDWARAQLTFADALRLRGENVRSTVDLEEAQFAYRAALGIFGRDRTPEDWAIASANLGQVMVRLGEFGAEAGTFQHGLQHIDGALALAARLGIALDVAKLQTARGNALLGMFAANDAERLAAEATEAFALALVACDQEKYPQQALSMRHRLGMAMWAYGARTAAADILGEAAQELAGALDDAEQLGDTARVAELREDLAALNDDIGRVNANHEHRARRIA